METINRKIQPDVIGVKPGEMTEPEVRHLSNGIPVYLINTGLEEIVRMDFIFDAGQVFEKAPLVSSTVSMMLNEGSENYTAENLNKALDYYGAVPNLFAEKDSAGLSVAFLTKYTVNILELCMEILFRPVFPPNELETLINKRKQWFHVSRERVQTLAYDKFFETVFGNFHPYGRMIKLEDFDGITTHMLSDFHSDRYCNGNLSIIIAGKIPENMISLLNESIGIISLKNSLPYLPQPFSPSGKSSKIFVEKNGAIQSAMRIGSLTINKKHPDYHGLKILDTILGGYFGSRLMRNIREDKGYTYGISSSVVSFNLAAYKVISTEVGAKNAEATASEIFREIKRLQEEPVEFGELEVVRNYMLGEMVRMFDGPFATADSFRAVFEFGLDYRYYSDFAKKIKTIGADEIIHLARSYYKIDDLFEIVVGPQ
jgi:zinc protease